jgi:hypothetical protein
MEIDTMAHAKNLEKDMAQHAELHVRTLAEILKKL